jgi:hypothetical protein
MSETNSSPSPALISTPAVAGEMMPSLAAASASLKSGLETVLVRGNDIIGTYHQKPAILFIISAPHETACRELNLRRFTT